MSKTGNQFDIRLEKPRNSMEEHHHLLPETLIWSETGDPPNLKSRRILIHYLSLDRRFALIFCLSLTLGAMIILCSFRYLFPSLLVLQLASAAWQVVPGAAWTDVSQ
jgi:hypothetical protein